MILNGICLHVPDFSDAEYRESGHTLKEASEALKVSIRTIGEWEKKLKESGKLENKPARSRRQ